MTAGTLRGQMVTALSNLGVIRSGSVRDALASEPREHYLADLAVRHSLSAVYQHDTALVTKTDRNGVAISSSTAVSGMAAMLEMLDVRAGMRVLEVGTGTGYNAALLARLVGARGQVTSVEVDPDIAHAARRALATAGHRVDVVVADGRNRLRPSTQFDRIIVTASSDTVPGAWHSQLADAGICVAPIRFTGSVAPQAVVALRRDGGRLRSIDAIPDGFMCLRETGMRDSPHTPLPAVTSNDPTGAGPAFLTGPALASLRDSQRRAALALLRREPRRSQPLSQQEAAALALFVALSGHRDVVQCAMDRRIGTGILTCDGMSIGAITHQAGVGGSIDVWGGPDSERELEPLVEEWASRNRPTLRDLRLVVDFERVARGPVWRQVEWQDSVWHLDWTNRAR